MARLVFGFSFYSGPDAQTSPASSVRTDADFGPNIVSIIISLVYFLLICKINITKYYVKIRTSQLAKNIPANAGDMGSISCPRRSPGEGNGNPL